MDTSGLESFAQNLRTDLLKGVRQRLRYWGFKEDGTVEEAPEEVEGGYVFRGEVHDDPGVPKKWRALKNAINRHDLDHVAEEAAYTWFNRLVAIRILEKNGHRTDVLGYADGTEQPAVLYRAKDGVIDVLGEDGTQDVRDAILDSDDDRAFRQLLIGVCHDSDLLNDVFGRINDFTELLLPTGLLQPDGVIEELVTTGAISDDDYDQVELIGWLYQFYISEKKDEVYDSSGKFQPEDIPAATQIFTPHWIVRYMVENTIGRQWLDKYPDSDLREEMDYLVEPDECEPQEPIFDDLSELELFDPAAGSGHILVVGFDLLMEMYRERGYTDREAVERILTENLKGLEIDRRAAQLARFALLMKAAQYDRRALDRDDLRPEVYAMPEPRDFSTSDLRAYLGDDVFDAHGAEIKEALDLIAEHGQNVGSALKMDLSDEAQETITSRVAHWDGKEEGELDIGQQDLVPSLRAYLKPLLLLTGDYAAVAMNPPYMGSSQMNGHLKSYVRENYPKSKRDLSAAFMRVGEQNLQAAGLLSMINQQSWMFLSSYQDHREKVLNTTLIESMLHLGARTFDQIGGEVVQSTAFVLQNALSQGRTGTYYRLVDEGSSTAKREAFERTKHQYKGVDQQDFQKIPGSAILYWLSETAVEILGHSKIIGDYAESKSFMKTGNNSKYLKCAWELNKNKVGFDNKWVYVSKGGGYRKWGGNMKYTINTSNDAISFYRTNRSSQLLNKEVWGKEGITWSDVCSGGISFRQLPSWALSESAGPSMFSKDDQDIDFLLGILNSKPSTEIIETLNPSLHFKFGDVKSIPVPPDAHEYKSSIKSLSADSQEKVWDDWKADETSLNFAEPALIQQNASSIKAAFNVWAERATDEFLQLHANEEELNELCVDLYGFEEELSPRVPLDDITILEDELDRDALKDLDDERNDLSDDELRQRFLEDDPDDALFKVEVPIHQFLSYGVGVMLGRYRLGHDGLNIAHPNPSDDELAPYDVPVPLSGSESNGTEQFEIDDDAIVPLMGRDSPFSDDAVYRMRDIVRLIWGEDTLTENLNFINHALSVGRSRGLKRDYEKTMEEWLVGDFWDWHKSLYSVPYYGKKPIYWLFQSPEGHFQVLVYMHRMDKFTPQRVRQDYLQRHQQYLRREIEALEAKGEETLTGDAATRLDRLREAAADCREYDVILKDVADRQIEIDLDDGVQNNYPKFGDAVADL